MLKVKTSRSILLVSTSIFAIALSICAASPASAQSTGANASSTETVVVTGVRGQPRSATDSPTPVDVVQGAELTESGQAGLYEQLGTAIPSFTMPFLPGGGTAVIVKSGGLRGLDPDQTLVLVNGQRFHSTALLSVSAALYNGSDPVDMAMIPTSGVDHIEVLREGAAAQYGSDAVAGVINVILKNTDGASMSLQSGATFDNSDGWLTQLNGNYGVHSDTGSLNLFVTAIDQQQSNRAIPLTGTFAAQLPQGYNKVVETGYGQDPYKHYQAGFNGHLNVGDIELYAYGVFNDRSSVIPYPGVYNLNANLPQVWPVIFQPQFKINELDTQLAVGARGNFIGWDWDLSSTAGQDRANERVSQDINASLGPTSPTAFYIGSLVSQEWANSLDVTRNYDLGSGSTLQASWGLQDRLQRFAQGAGDVASYANGGYQIPLTQGPSYPGQSSFAGQFPVPGAYYTPGFQPSNAGAWTRNVFALYGQLGYAPNDRLLIEAATRFEDYSDSSGSSVIGKVDGRYKMTDWLTLRGSVGNGFHAPTLVQEHYSQIKGIINPTTGQVTSSAVVTPDSSLGAALGASPLRPETSTDASVGMTLLPASNFNVTVDGYVVDVYSRLAITGILSGAGVNSILAANGLAAGQSAQYVTNAINTRTSGVDVVGTYNTDLDDFGNLRMTGAFSLNNTTIKHIAANPAALSSLSPAPVLFDATTQGYLTSGLPKTKLVLTADWTWQRFEVHVNEIRYGDYSIINNVAANSRNFPAAWITNLEAKVHLTDTFSFAAGATNLFNTYPPATAIFSPQYGYAQYPRTSPFGITGGSYYGRLQFDLN